MKKALISLSFDDGRGDNFAVFRDILFPMSIPATLNITTGYVDGSCPANSTPTQKPALSVDEIKVLSGNPLVEIALHGDHHLNTPEDVSRGREKLIQWLGLPADHVFGFASPGSGLPVDAFINSDERIFAKQISYLRSGMQLTSCPLIRSLCRKIGRVIHIPMLYRIAYYDTLMDDCTDRVIYSVPVMGDITFPQIKAIVELAVRRRSAVTLMFHSIVEDTRKEDSWSWERNKFRRLCEYLAAAEEKGKLQVCTTQQLYEMLQGG